MAIAQDALAVEQTASLVANFAARLQTLNVRVERVGDSVAAAKFLVGVANEIGTPGFVISSELTNAAPALMAALTEAGAAWLSPADLVATRDAPLGVSLAKFAIAETGSAMLAEETLADRGVGMLTKSNVIVVRTETIVPSLDEAAAALKAHALRPGGGYASLVTGPSRTADIELSLSLGVQGPERVFVAVVDELT